MAPLSSWANETSVMNFSLWSNVTIKCRSETTQSDRRPPLSASDCVAINVTQYIIDYHLPLFGPDMDWGNEMVLEFLQYYESEPIIWNPLHENHRKKHLVNDAWRRIENSLSWACSIEELKKKKDSLMAYYRIHMSKIKKSKQSGEDEFKTSWFAFATMDSFLRPNYECDTTIDNEVTITNDSLSAEKYDPIYIDNSGNSAAITQETLTRPTQLNKRKHLNVTREIAIAKHQMKEVFEHIKRVKTNLPPSKSLNEYEIFGSLVASRIQKIESSLDREILMNDINNLIFKAVMKSLE